VWSIALREWLKYEYLMQFTAAQIAEIAGGIVEGDGDVSISSFAKIEEGRPGAISFLANPKYTHYIYTTESSAVLVSNAFVAEHPVHCTLIRVSDPYATVAMLMEMAAKVMQPVRVGIEEPCFIAEGVEIPDDVYVGAFTYIAKGAKIGKGARIYPQCHIGENTTVGENTILYAGVKVYHNCHIGNNCILHSGVVIGADGFGFAPVDGHYNKIPQMGNVVLCDEVEVGANTTIDRATMGSTIVGRGTKLDNLIQVAHNCVIGENTVMAAQVGIAGSAKIGSNCMVGGQVGFKGHIEVGDDVQIGAQAGISGNVKPGSRLLGSPAIDIHQYAKQVVLQKNLPDLYERIKKLEKEIQLLRQKDLHTVG